MATLKIIIATDNDAFSDSRELCRILDSVKDRLKDDMSDSVIRDINGNTVGSVTVYEREDY